jgi:hypothetical protein
MRPASRGRGHPFQLRSCHIRVLVDGEKRVPKKPATAAVSKSKQGKEK